MRFHDSSPVFQHRHLLGIEGLSCSDVDFLLDRAQFFLEHSHKSNVAFSKKIQINLFYEASTRTLCSFEIAGKKLGLGIVNIALDHSSAKKGETFLDTVLTLNAMNPHLLVFRHPAAGAARFISQKVSCPVVNAGDGAHEHPTQALLDALTIKRAKGKIAGLVVVICGDILHSRVARSNIFLLNLLGAKIRVVAPSIFLPSGIEKMGVEVFHSLSSALEEADVIMMLRMQHERILKGVSHSSAHYFHSYGMDEKKLRRANTGALVMHPGPVHRGVDISSCLMNTPHSLILEQVKAGVALRMAVIETLLKADDGVLQ